MKKILSVKWNIIKFDKKTIEKKIEDILACRFEDEKEIDLWMNDLHDPYLLAWMEKAVNRIKLAKNQNERVVIFWDYDVDWVTSTSILMHFLKTIWMQVSYRLPHRVKDWYWLKNYFIDELKELEVSLIITVDCWSKDIDVIDYAKDKGIDIIVTDHHVVPECKFESAIAVVNPKRADCKYPYKNLSWAWVAFKLVSALIQEYFDEQKARQYLKETIDIAALWTVADCMELTWENRIIVREGLKQLKNTRSKWIKKLIENKINEDFDADVFSFTIWPFLNAAWRMDTPYKALNLILNSWVSLNNTIREVEKLNEQRKYLSKQFFMEAVDKVDINDNILFYISPAIEHWIIWIISWRLTEQFYKPSIVLKDEWDKLVASCRSPEYYSIIDVLDEFKDYFVYYWWHKQAAWFTIEKDKFAEFKTKLINKLNKEDFAKYKKILEIDKVIRLNDLWFTFLNKMNKYKPFWIWNKKPVFLVENLNYTKIDFMWKTKDHIRFTTKEWFKIVWFFMWDYYEQIRRATKINLIFDLSEDYWMGNRNLMLKIVDLVLE